MTTLFNIFSTGSFCSVSQVPTSPISCFPALPSLSVSLPIPVSALITFVLPSIISPVVPSVISAATVLAVLPSVPDAAAVTISSVAAVSVLVNWFPDLVFLLSLLIMNKVVEYASGVFVAVKYFKH